MFKPRTLLLGTGAGPGSGGGGSGTGGGKGPCPDDCEDDAINSETLCDRCGGGMVQPGGGFGCDCTCQPPPLPPGSLPGGFGSGGPGSSGGGGQYSE